MKVMSVGEIIFDVFGDESEIGGAPLNFCAHCTALGAESVLISAVGEDELGETALKALDDFGVDSSLVQRNECPTGVCEVTLKNGSPTYNIRFDAAYFKTRVDDKVITDIRRINPDVFAFGTLIQRAFCLRSGIKKILEECSFKDIFCDINLRSGCYDKESCINCFENATILKLSSEEEPLMHEFGLYEVGNSPKETVRNICSTFPGIKIVLFTKGEEGSLIYDARNKKFYDIPCIKAQTVSTVGAGDSYSAAFLCEYYKSGDVEKSGLAGAELSSFVVSHREAVPKRR